MTRKRATTRSTDELGRRLKDFRRDLLRTLALTDAELSTLERHQAGSRAEDAATATVGDILSRLGGQQRHELDEIEDALTRAGAKFDRLGDDEMIPTVASHLAEGRAVVYLATVPGGAAVCGNL